MSTLYLRNVPDDLIDRLKRLAERDSMSVTAVAVRELAEVTRDVDNAALLATLPDLKIPTTAIVEALDAERATR